MSAGTATLETKTSRLSQRELHRPCPMCGSTEASLLYQAKGYFLKTCHSCSLAYISNPPTPEELSKLYSFEESYHQEFSWSPKSRAEFLKRGETYLRYILPHQSSGRLLDLGCSAGFFLQVARQAGFEVEGLEFSPDTVRLGKELYDLNIHCGTIHDHPFQAGSFSAVTLWDVIEHVPDPLNDLRRIWELLQPGGIVAMSTPNIDGLYPRVSYQLYPWTGFYPHPAPPYHLTQFSAETLSRMCRRAGFEVVQVCSRRIPLLPELGSVKQLARAPKRLLFALAMAPFSLVGPWLGMGDETVLIARKISRPL